MNKRKLFGTIIGIVFWSICIVFFTYAYYEWKSDNTNVVIGIQDISTECVIGPDVNATNIGPVLDPADGVKASFNLKNDTSTSETFSVVLNITSISENLLVEDFKYMLVEERDYDNPVVEGNFSSLAVGTNYITSTLSLAGNTTSLFEFIVYIDGTHYNDISLQGNSLVANLEIGDCGFTNGPNLMKLLFPTYTDYTYFKSGDYRKKIKTASFVDYIETDTSKIVTSWDVSVNEDNSIVAWLENNTTDGYYDLYIGSDTLIYTESLFSVFIFLR